MMFVVFVLILNTDIEKVGLSPKKWKKKKKIHKYTTTGTRIII